MGTQEGCLAHKMPCHRWAASYPDSLTACVNLPDLLYEVYPLAILSYRKSPEKPCGGTMSPTQRLGQMALSSVTWPNDSSGSTGSCSQLLFSLSMTNGHTAQRQSLSKYSKRATVTRLRSWSGLQLTQLWEVTLHREEPVHRRQPRKGRSKSRSLRTNSSHTDSCQMRKKPKPQNWV